MGNHFKQPENFNHLGPSRNLEQ